MYQVPIGNTFVECAQKILSNVFSKTVCFLSAKSTHLVYILSVNLSFFLSQEGRFKWINLILHDECAASQKPNHMNVWVRQT